MKNFVLAGFVGLCSMLMFGLNANAYIDPSVMTYLIQVVAGIVVAVGAVAGIYFRKAKKKVSEKPHLPASFSVSTVLSLSVVMAPSVVLLL